MYHLSCKDDRGWPGTISEGQRGLLFWKGTPYCAELLIFLSDRHNEDGVTVDFKFQDKGDRDRVIACNAIIVNGTYNDSKRSYNYGISCKGFHQ